jgi:SAM-dependent methyltransferase
MPDDRARWSAKFLAGEAQAGDPDRLLIEVCSALSPGRALDLAGGAGRHAIWLAQRGWDVTLSDISDEGLAIATQRASAAGVPITFRRESSAQTLAWASASGPFELILVFWHLLRDSFNILPQALATDGTLIYKTYTSDHPRFTEGHSLLYALAPGELSTAFPTFRTILYRESNGVAELLARAE